MVAANPDAVDGFFVLVIVFLFLRWCWEHGVAKKKKAEAKTRRSRKDLPYRFRKRKPGEKPTGDRLLDHFMVVELTDEDDENE